MVQRSLLTTSCIKQGKWFKTINFTWSISYSAATWPSGLGAGFFHRKWSRCGFESRCGHFRFLCTFFLFSFRFFVHIFSLWLVFLYSHPWAFTASRDFCDNAFLVYVVTGVLARSTGWYLGILIPPKYCEYLYYPRSRHFPIFVLGTFSALFLNLEQYFTFRAILNTFLTFEQKLSIFFFWATTKHLIFFTIFHMLNTICCLWNVFSKPSNYFITNLNNWPLCRLTVVMKMLFLNVETIHFGKKKHWCFTSIVVTY